MYHPIEKGCRDAWAARGKESPRSLSLSLSHLSLSSSLNKDREALYDKYNVSLILSSESTSPFHVLFFYWSIKSTRAYAQLHTKCSAPFSTDPKGTKEEEERIFFLYRLLCMMITSMLKL